MFNEKEVEVIFENNQKLELKVWQSPKYLESRKKALEIINSPEYKNQILEGDFWILMNKTKSGKMAYTGLIISHNGCLKLNDLAKVEDRFRPECISVDISGYANSLVFTYKCQEQGIYEVGEVNSKNCKNDYPYAMAFKRCFDRVVLKISKLAYAGIYSDSEADEFTQQIQVEEQEKSKEKLITPEQINQLKEIGMDDEGFKKMAAYYKKEKIEDVTFKQAEETIRKKQKAKTKQEPKPGEVKDGQA